MKALKFIMLLLFTLSVGQANAQFFKKLKERAKKAAEETIKQKTEEEASKRTGDAMDSIFNTPEKIGKKKKRRKGERNGNNSSDNSDEELMEDGDEGFSINSAFDFVPGNQALFYDDLGPDNIGDFPSKWDTNGSGEVVDINGEKWFRLLNKSIYIPLTNKDLPENYSIEFDLQTHGLDNKTSSNSKLVLMFADNDSFENPSTYSSVEISVCQFVPSPGYLRKYIDGKRQLMNNVGRDYREAIDGRSRVSILVNGPRLRVWLNDEKLVDVPRLVGEGITNFKLITDHIRTDANQDEIYIKDFRIAESVEDSRSKLLTDGKISTNAILFASGSADLKSPNSPIIDEIADVLVENPEVSILIVGHTDSDGNTDQNLQLSKERANTVKAVITNNYGIDSSRIQTDGKGASMPVADNDSPEGKAKNRRVEFIKQ